jgi:oxygen-dependent protoporphyrinogen oxidase
VAPVVVVGGGITGLSAAYELASRGVPFQLLEASSRAGGLILTEHVDGFTIEAGPDSVLAQKPAAVELCEALGLGPRLISTTPPRTAYVHRDGHLYPLPPASILGIPTTVRGMAHYDLLPWPARLRLAADLLLPGRPRDDEPVAGFFRRRFGRATVDLIAAPLLGGIHAGDVEQLSIRSLFPRFAEAEARRGSVLRAFRGASSVRRRQGSGDGGGMFRSLSAGMGELVTAIERRVPAGSIQYDCPVSSLRYDGERWHVMAHGREFPARAVILAIPAHAAARLLAPVDEGAASLCAEVPYVSTASIALAWPRSAVTHPLDGSGFVVARKHSTLRITACTWVSSKWSGRAPEGSVLLRAFIGGAHDPRAIDLPDDELVSTAAGDIAPVLGIQGAPILSRVYRWRDAGPQHNVGQIARVAAIEAALASHPGLFAAGSGFRSVGIPDCIADGRAAAATAAAFANMRTPALEAGPDYRG